MTKRKTTQKPNTAGAATPTINSTPPVSPAESVKGESNTVATPKPKRANNKAPAKPRGRPKKKVIIEQVYEILPLKQPTPPEEVHIGDDGTVTIVNPSEKRKVTYVAPATLALPTPSLYSRFKDWLVFKLYHYTSYFRGY